MTVYQVLHWPGWWCGQRFCQQERQIHIQNKYLFLCECISSKTLPGWRGLTVAYLALCGQLVSSRTSASPSFGFCCLQMRQLEVTVARSTLVSGSLCHLSHEWLHLSSLFMCLFFQHLGWQLTKAGKYPLTDSIYLIDNLLPLLWWMLSDGVKG